MKCHTSKYHLAFSHWRRCIEYCYLFVSVTLYGTWFSHTTEWWRLSKTNPNIYVIFYEDLKKNPVLEISKLAKFLDCQHSPEFLAKVAEMTSFAQMKENAMKNDKTVERSRTAWKTGDWMIMRKGDALSTSMQIFFEINSWDLWLWPQKAYAGIASN